MFKKVGVIFWIIITIIPILGILSSLFFPLEFYSTQAEFKAFAERYNTYTPLAFILLQVLQVVITPLSHYSVGYMGGFLYGPIYGGLLNYIGRIIGHLCAFGIGKLIGYPVVNKYVSEKTLQKYNKYVANRADILFLIYFLPLFPDDEISYLVSISKMKFSRFFIANLFGHVGGSLSLAYIGSGIDSRDPYFWILFGVTLLGFPILYYLSKKSPVKLDS